MRLQEIPDPSDRHGTILVDLDDLMTIKITTNWCSGCQANVSWEGGRWTTWLGEPDKWYCEEHK